MLKTNKGDYFNPFELFSYLGEAYFCDREEELRELNAAFENRRNMVLSSMRRLGKTLLIRHWHHGLKRQKKVIPIYLDIMHTSSDIQFVNKLATAVLLALEEQETIVNKAMKLFQSFRPKFGVDPVSGMPELSLDLRTEREVHFSMEAISALLAGRKERMQIAIDEFQVIGEYPQTGVDAAIRGSLIPLDNVHMLFCGSEAHLLNALFSSANKPLFASTQSLSLGYIPYDLYFDFIRKQFEAFDKRIGEDVIDEILRWTRRHSFYTHFLCNQLFSLPDKKATMKNLEETKYRCLQQFELTYLYYKKLLSKNQWRVIAAIAKEEQVSEITSKHFLNKYLLSASSASQALVALIKDGMVYEIMGDEKPSYIVYDVFFSRWLEHIV